MAYEPVGFHSFGGLDLVSAPDEIGANGAIDMLNVDLDHPGSVRQRNGYNNFTSSALTNRVDSLASFYTTGGTKQLIAGCGTRLEALDTAGAVVAAQTGLTTGIWDFARFGAPGAERLYAANGANRLYSWNGAAWAAVAGLDANTRPKYLAVMAVDQGNRMVLAGFPDSATGSPAGGQAYTSRVWFSDAGAPETYGANNYVDLTPGDGELIQNVVAWREYVIVFKQTKFFVFYGTSTAAAGTPIFNYRTVDTGVGLASPRAVAVAPDCVYFMARDGVYRTTGSDPEPVSRAIEPIWLGNSQDFFGGGLLSQNAITDSAMHFHQGRLYATYTTSATGNHRTLVYDPRTDNWLLWNVSASSFASLVDVTESLVFGYASGSNHVGIFSSTYTDDDGTAILSRYQTGFYDFGLEQEKTIAETAIWGLGNVGLSIATDLGTVTDSPTTVALGSVTIARGWLAKETLGDLFSHQLSSVNGGAWTVHRLTHHLRESRPPGINQ